MASPGSTLHEIDAGENVVGLSVVAIGVGENIVGDIGGSGQVTLEDLHLGELQAGQLRGLRRKTSWLPSGRNAICWSLWRSWSTSMP